MLVSFCPLRSVSGERRPGYRSYTVTFKVVVASNTAGPQAVVQALNQIPTLSFYIYGDDLDTQAKLVRIGVPRRAGNDKLPNTWLVDCFYEFDQTQRPEFQGTRVEPFFITESEPIPRAKHTGVYRDINGDLQLLPIEQGQETFTIGKYYPISNSASVPIIPAPEREKAKPAYRVSWTTSVASFDYGPYINTFNSDPFDLTGTSINVLSETYTDERVRFSRLFAAGTLRLRDVQSTIVQFYGYDWYNITLEFVEEDQIHYELDRGLTSRARAGDPDGNGGTYSEGDFPEGAVGQREIMDPTGNPIAEPVLLNGRGQPLDQTLAREPRYLGWERYPSSNFDELPIGDKL